MTTPSQPSMHYAEMIQIRASAGSGKTYEITSRFLALLATAQTRLVGACDYNQEGHSWSEIMAITFTNKAASEMRERIIYRLKAHALGAETSIPALTPPVAKTWVNTILRSYSALNVRTIDSLLHSIVRLSALDFGLPPDFEPSFDKTEALNPLLDELLEAARTDPTLKNDLQEACTYLYNHTPLKGFSTPKSLRTNIIQTYLVLRSVPKGTLATATDIIQRLVLLHAKMRDCAILFDNMAKKNQIPMHQLFSKALIVCMHSSWKDPVPSSKLLRKAALEELIKKDGHGLITEALKDAHKALYASIAALDEKTSLLKGALSIMPYINLANHISERIHDFIIKHRFLYAEFIPLLARQVLIQDHGVATVSCRLGSQMQHILIDEFQDTSREQWQVLFPIIKEALDTAGSFTYVGDVKQAVYGWRGGDARLFDEIFTDNTLTACIETPRQIPLTTNWRTQKNIVEHNFDFFKHLNSQSTARDTLTALTPKETPDNYLDKASIELKNIFGNMKQNHLKEKTDGYVYIQRIVAEKAEDRDEAVHTATLERIQSIHARRPYKDIAILVRKNSEAERLASWLMQAHIPVITENSLYVNDHPLVSVLVSLLAFMDNPLDEAAFWHCATNKYFLPEEMQPNREDLEVWAATRSQKMPMYQAFREYFPETWTHLFAPFMQASGPYASLLGSYSATSEAIDYFKLMERFPEHAAFLRRFLEILYLAEEQGYMAIKTFLDYWKEHGGKEKAPMPETLDAVQIVTIHKAKGLEFPVVIVPWHDNTPYNDAPLVVKELDGLSFITPANKHMPQLFYANCLAKAQESLQVLYVAWTRPKEELHLFLTETPFTRSRYGLINAIDILAKNLTFDKEGVYTRGTVPKAQKKQPPPLIYTAQPLHIEPTPLPWRPLQWLPNLRVWRNPIADLSDNAKRRGVFIHHCLACLMPTGTPKDDAHKALEQGFATFPLPLHDTPTLRRETLNSLTWVASLPDAPVWFAQGQTEQACLDAEGRLWRPDLIVMDSQTRLPSAIIEYKTGKPHASHITQLRQYKELLQAITHKTIKATLLYVDLQDQQDL